MDSEATEVLSPASTYTEFMEWLEQANNANVFCADACVGVISEDVFMNELNELINFHEPQPDPPSSTKHDDFVQTGTIIV
uniref:Uncharacterized protein n=1 Tax=Tetranychus urticae TaxID=32264 RepID=T1K5A9_TETUR